MPFAIGSRIEGIYRVKGIREGGSGSIYFVEDQASGERFAIKTLHPRFEAQARLRHRFAVEARTWLGIGPHENVIRALAFRSLEGRPGLFLEFIDGVSLDTLIVRGKPIHPPQAVGWAREIASGMAFVHGCAVGPKRRRMVHRDIKPGNILIARGGRAKITDFGLVGFPEASHHLTQEGVFLGTPQYLAPEQIREPAAADQRADVYSFGATLYEMLAGRPPFEAESLAALVYRVLNDPPPELEAPADSPADLRALVAQCLAKEREERPASFEEIRSRLRAIGEGMEVSETLPAGYWRCPPAAGSPSPWSSHPARWIAYRPRRPARIRTQGRWTGTLARARWTGNPTGSFDMDEAERGRDMAGADRSLRNSRWITAAIAGATLAASCLLCLPCGGEGKEIFSCTFEKKRTEPWRLIGGTWEFRDDCLRQIDTGRDDPCKAVLVLEGDADLSTDIEFTARLRVDLWTDSDYARAGIGLCADPQSGHGLNLLFHRGRLQFMRDYVAWAPGCEFACRTGTWYWMKLHKTAGEMRGKAWPDGEPEPADWMTTWRDYDDGLTGYPALVGCSAGPTEARSMISFDRCRLVAPGGVPSGYYTKMSTWQETMAAASDALARQEASLGARPGSLPGNPRRERLWKLLARDFPDATSRRQMAWERQDQIWTRDWPPGRVDVLAARYGEATRLGFGEEARDLARTANRPEDIEAIRRLYYRSREVEEALARWSDSSILSLRLAVEDLTRTFGARYARGPEFLRRIAEIEDTIARARVSRAAGGRLADLERLFEAVREFESLRAQALLANPLLDFDRLLLVKRRDARDPKARPRIQGDAGLFAGNDLIGFLNGLPINFQGNGYLRDIPFDNEIAVLSPVGPDGSLTTLYRPEKPVYVGDLKLHFDADRLLFSSIGSHDRWQIFEIATDGEGLRQVTRGEESDIDNYDSCYLPDGRILYASTICLQSVPCERRCDEVANFCSIESDGSGARRLCFDQDHNFYPSMMADGRILYTRWEYTDIAHAFTGRLMTMNPDGSMQRAHYATGSFWPNRIFYARPIPEHPTMFAGIVTGHHGTARAGELVLFDVARGRRQADGAVQRIPGWGKRVDAKMVDNLVDGSWPKFLHPHPLSDKYFLVSCQPSAQSRWGIYLVDVFDNMLLLREEEGFVLFEPVPVRKTPRPPVIPSRTNPASREATVYLLDIYLGEGLKGIPRGTIERLRLFTYHFNYYGTSGIEDYVGMDGPWDIRRVLGTVPVDEDGSAYFTIPAETPIAIQPLDAEGKAVQLMRSWFTAMPGEVVSCTGCHEDANRAPPISRLRLPAGEPSQITPWFGSARGFSWDREVQPVLDRYCVGCHDGRPRPDGRTPPDLRRAEPRSMPLSPFPFPPSFYALRRFVRSPGLEGPSVIPVGDYHADTNILVQMLRKGHHNVCLDGEAWDRLVTWIDMNAPAYGTWLEIPTVRDRERYLRAPTEFFSAGMLPLPPQEIERQRRRRIELARQYGGACDDPEDISPLAPTPVAFVVPPADPPAEAIRVAGWPFDAAEAARMEIELAPGVKLELARIPAGEFPMGGHAGYADEKPASAVRIDRPFWIGRTEVTNAQYRIFDPAHDSGVEPMLWLKWHPGHLPSLNQPQQPVCRVSWDEASTFCEWLSARTGRRFALPSEAQWEWACRAGTDTSWSHSAAAADSAAFANTADDSLLDLGRLASMEKVRPFFAVDPVNDKSTVSAPVGSYRANPWGLLDMHGNVAEWTRSAYLPYPFRGADPRHAEPGSRKAVRGGSWRQRADMARSSCRTSYWPWQSVFDVGFRVVCEAAQ